MIKISYYEQIIIDLDSTRSALDIRIVISQTFPLIPFDHNDHIDAWHKIG